MGIHGRSFEIYFEETDHAMSRFCSLTQSIRDQVKDSCSRSAGNINYRYILASKLEHGS